MDARGSFCPCDYVHQSAAVSAPRGQSAGRRLYALAHSAGQASTSASSQIPILHYFLFLVVCGTLSLLGARSLLRYDRRLGKTRPTTCKIIQEPRCDSGADRRHLTVMRRLTATLGGPWLPRLPFMSADFPFAFPDDPETDSAASSDEEYAVRQVACMLLKPGFTPEFATVTLELPALIAELTGLLHIARVPADRDLFPSLLPVSCQPLSGTALFLSLPEWCRHRFVCLDTTSFDRRLFAVQVPEYVGKAELLAIADLPPGLEVAVWIDSWAEPLDWETRVHTYAGQLVRFLPPEEPPPSLLSLAQALQAINIWETAVAVPLPNFVGAYCIAQRQHSCLYISDPFLSSIQRHNIADFVGIPAGRLVLFPATPRPTDVALNGVPCQTVVAVGDTANAAQLVDSHLVILDCRALAAGWLTVPAYEGWIDTHEVLDHLREWAVPGWQLYFSDSHDTRFRRAAPGQVFKLSLRPMPSVLSTLGSTDIAMPVQSRTSGGHPGQGYAAADGSSAAEHTAATPPDATTAGHSSTADASVRTTMCFRIFAPAYVYERVQLEVEEPLTVSTMLAQVNAGRQATDRARFPRLMPVDAQPAFPFASLLALPSWHTVGVPVLIVCYLPPVRVFADTVPALLTTADVLRLAGEAEDAPVQIFVADVPWAFRRGAQFYVRAGASIRICPYGQPVVPPLALTRMIGSFEGWYQGDATNDDPALGYWLLSTYAPRRFVVEPLSRPMLRTAAAAFLALPEDRLILLPAIPNLRDHSFAGSPSRQVFVAVGSSDGEQVPFILDARPVLLGLQWYHARHGRVEVGPICQSHRARCPPGYVVRLQGGHGPLDTANHFRSVFPGQVLTVTYQPSWAGDAHSPGDDTGNDGDDAPGPSGRNHPGTTTPEASSDGPAPTGSTDQGPDAGTGSTRGSAPAPARQSYALFGARTRARSKAKWTVGFGQAAFSEGTQLFTPVFLLCFLGFAIGPGSVLQIVEHVLANLAGLVGWGGLAALYGSYRPAPARVNRHLLCALLLLATMPFPASGVQINWTRADKDSSETTLRHNARADILAIPRPLRAVASCRVGLGAVDLASCGTAIAQDLDCKADPGNTLCTLLEEAAWHPDSPAFYLAATLLETLHEHFAEHHGLRGANELYREAVAATQIRTPISLEDSVPATQFQRQAMDLLRVVPSPPTVEEKYDGVDWLDVDLSHLCRCPKVPARWRQSFAQLTTWHKAGCPKPHKLEIFTDGSADSGEHSVGGGPAAWAFTVWAIVADQAYLVGGSSHTLVPPGTPYYLGESSDSSLVAELSALAWALAWTLEHGVRFRVWVEFCYDATSAGGGVFGEMKAPSEQGGTHPLEIGKLANLLRQAVAVHVPISHRHVKGHSGHLANELCDQLAKYARRWQEDPYERILPLWPAQWASHPLRDWIWAAHVASPCLPALPALESEAQRLQRVRHDTKAPVAGLSTLSLQAARVEYSLSFVSYNVQTLFDPTAPAGKVKRSQGQGLFIAGKRDLLKKQFLDKDIWAVGLQETRLPNTEVLPDKYFIMLSAAANDAGQYGCSIWFNCHKPYASENGKRHYLRREHIVVTTTSPRCLQVQIDAPRLTLTIAVLHGPSTPRGPTAEAQEFWAARAREWQARSDGSDIVLLADANAHLGSVPTEAVGDLDMEPENAAGEEFHSCLLAQDLFLPSTFSSMHVGPSFTWCGPGDDGAKHRLDYVVLPRAWAGFAVSSLVLQDFEALQSRQDHFPVCLYVVFGKALPAAAYTTTTRKACRPAQVTGEKQLAQRSTFVAALASHAPTVWSEGIDQHCQAASTALCQAAEAVVDPPRQVPRQPYLQPDTLGLVRRRMDVRRYLIAEQKELDRRLRMLGFAAFVLHTRRLSFTAGARTAASTWLYDMDYSIARALDMLRWLTRSIRVTVRRDRVAYLQGLVDRVSHADLRNPLHLYATVRRAFPKARSARRSSFQPLPAVRLADGSLARTVQERSDRWIEHFAEQEKGVVAELSEYPSLQPGGRKAGSLAPTFELQAVPTLFEIEQQFLSLPLRKAAGPDALTAEALRVCPAKAAQVFYPLYLKVSLAIREPSAWRGGHLMCLAKRASALLDCDAFRSILLASVPAKVLHRVWRDRLTPHLAQAKGDLQAGQLPGVGVDSIALAVKTYQGWARSRHLRLGLLFFDVKAAFYKVIREALVESEEGDARLVGLLTDLGVPLSALPELVEKLQTAEHLATAGVGRHMQAQLADLLRGTWFRLDGCSTLVLTTRGSRPGDPLADILFAFSFAAYLRAAEKALEENDLASALPHTDMQSPWTTWEAPRSLGCAAWADDYAQAQVAPTVKVLFNRIIGAASLLSAHATAGGMQLTYAADKTAVLLSADCTTQAEDGVEWEHGQAGLRIRNEVLCTSHFLPIVASYKHLGGILTAAGTPAADIQFRHAQALSILKPLYSRLFSAQAIPLPIRRTLLRALVISRYVFSGAASLLDAAVHRRAWCQHYVALWRGLCRWRRGTNTPHSYTVLQTAGAPNPLLALAHMRAILLRRVVKFGPATLLHVLQVHWRTDPSKSWLGLLKDDIEAVAVYSDPATVLLQMTDPVECLLGKVQEDVVWWPRVVKQAISAFGKRLQRWRPDIGHPGGPLNPAEDRPFVCPQCDASFPLRKHLAVHQARRHGLLSPTRHYAPSSMCLACLRLYHSVERCQYHLKQSKTCLLRLVHVVPPLSLEEIQQAEADDKKQKKALKLGKWKEYQAVTPAAQAFGPRQPTHSEVLTGLDEDDVPVSLLQRIYRPTPDVVSWIREYAEGRSAEGPRHSTSAFWLLPVPTAPS